MRLGELLALTRADIDTEKKTISISKSYQRFDMRDVFTEPKTAKSKRVVSIPEFLAADFEDFFSKLYKLKKEDRIFRFTKGYLTCDMYTYIPINKLRLPINWMKNTERN